MQTTVARGIALLKRGEKVMDFVHHFLTTRGITHYTLNQRADGGWATSPMMFLNHNPMTVLTFHFLQFDFDDIGFHAKDLSAEELERDIKPLTKLIYG